MAVGSLLEGSSDATKKPPWNGVADIALKTAEKAASNNSNTGSACLLASEIAQADAPSELAVLLRMCYGVMQLAQAHRPSSRSSSKCSS